MAVLRPSKEYDCEVWNANQCQAKALESIQLRACKYIMGCYANLGLKIGDIFINLSV